MERTGGLLKIILILILLAIGLFIGINLLTAGTILVLGSSSIGDFFANVAPLLGLYPSTHLKDR